MTDEKARGGSLGSTDPNRFMEDILKFSFAVMPLLRAKFLKKVPKYGFSEGGHVLEDDYPTSYLPGVGRQVSAEGGRIGNSRFDPIDAALLIGRSLEPFRGGAAYTDAGGQSIEAPYVTGMKNGYPSFLPHFSLIPPSRASGGEVEGEVSFAPSEVEQPKKEYEPFNVLPLREDEKGIHFDPRAGVLGSIISGLTAPGDVATGKLDPMSDEGVKRAIDLAGLATTGSSAFERPAGSLAAGASRVTNPIGMHSPGAEAARALPQEKGTPEQVLAMLRKIVPEQEIAHSGIEKEIAGLPSVNREDVAKHFESKLPQILEKVYGGEPPVIYEPKSISNVFKEYDAPSSVLEGFEDVLKIETPDKKRYWLGQRSGDDGYDIYGKDFTHLGTQDTLEQAQKYVSQLAHDILPTNYDEYSMPGGSNYREVVLHEPGEQSNYKSSHFPSTPNYLAHMRMKDYELPEGGKGLLIDELQSDRAQQGRKAGFRPSSSVLNELEANAEKAREKISDYYRSLPERHRPTEDELQRELGRMAEGKPPMFVHPEGEAKSLIDDFTSSYGDLSKAHEGISPGPYVEDTNQWTDLSLKRALKEALEGGYNRLMITPGAEHADRYGLQKQFGNIQYSPDTKTLLGYDNKMGRKVMEETVEPDDLEAWIGKDLANRLLSNEPVVIGNTRVHSIVGDDLVTGGEGMKGYYDKIVPRRLEKLLKKYDKGAKIEPFTLETDEGAKTVHSIPITPALRKALEEKGLPAFRKGGSIS